MVNKVLGLIVSTSLLSVVSQAFLIERQADDENKYSKWLEEEKKDFPMDCCSNGTILIDPYWVLTIEGHLAFTSEESESENKHLLFKIDNNIYKREIHYSVNCPLFNPILNSGEYYWHKEWNSLKLYRLKEPVILSDYPPRLRAFNRSANEIVTVVSNVIDLNHSLSHQIGRIRYYFDDKKGVYTPHDLSDKNIPRYRALINSKKDMGSPVFVKQSRNSYLLGLVSHPFDERAYTGSSSSEGKLFDSQMYIDKLIGANNSWIDYTILSSVINSESVQKNKYHNMLQFFNDRLDLSVFYNYIKILANRYMPGDEVINAILLGQSPSEQPISKYSLLVPTNEALNKMPEKLKSKLKDESLFLISFIRGHVVISNKSLFEENEIIPHSRLDQKPLTLVKDNNRCFLQEFGYSKEDRSSMTRKQRASSPELRSRQIPIKEVVKIPGVDIYIIGNPVVHLKDLEVQSEDLRLSKEVLDIL